VQMQQFGGHLGVQIACDVRVDGVDIASAGRQVLLDKLPDLRVDEPPGRLLVAAHQVVDGRQ
jgi:hypothetical protein